MQRELTLTRFEDVHPYTTKDGSLIRELYHPDKHGPGNQSLAEAEIASGGHTMRHLHRLTEEIYHFIQGNGEMRLGENAFNVAAGDTVHIPPNTPHQVYNTGQTPLKILCACVPPYRHDDTEVLEPESSGT